MLSVTGLLGADTMTEYYRVYGPYGKLGYQWRAGLDALPETPQVLTLHRAIFPMHREDWVHGTRTAIEQLQAQGHRVVAEFDDDFTRVPIVNTGYWGNPQTIAALEQACRSADALLVSTEFLAQELRRFNPHVFWIANRIDPALWHSAPSEQPIVGLMGGSQHQLDWQHVPEMFAAVRQAIPDVTLRTIGYNPIYLDFPHEVTPRVPWRDVPRVLPGLMVGWAPLDPDLVFNFSKSCCKWYELTMAGAVTVAQKCLPYTAEIEHGVTGFLASAPSEFAEYTSLLLRDPDLRAQVLARATTWILAHRNLATEAGRWAKVYGRVQSGRARRAGV